MTIVDVRPVEIYARGHIKGSIHIALSGQFATWAGTLIAHDKEMVIVAENLDKVKETQTRMARASHETLVGYFIDDMAKFDPKHIDKIDQISVSDLKDSMDTQTQVLDVRRPQEYFAGHVPGAINIPLNELEKRIAEVDGSKKTYIICRSGYRSSVAGSILEKHGANNLTNVTGGTMAWLDSGYEVDKSSDAPNSKQCQTA